MVSGSSTYLQKRGITDPQTDALAYTRFLDIIQKENPSSIIGVVEIDTTKEGAIKHFGTLNK